MARPIARLKLGYFPLPIEEAQNIRSCCYRQHHIRHRSLCRRRHRVDRNHQRHRRAPDGIELDADRADAAIRNGVATIHGSAFECRVLAETCSLLYLNPPYDSEFGPHSNKRMELVFLEHCYRWVNSEGVLVFVFRLRSWHVRASIGQPV